MASYRPVFDASVVDALGQLSKQKERKALALVRELALHPFLRSDYSLPDESGRSVDYLLVEEFVFGYWLDHIAREVRIVEIELAL